MELTMKWLKHGGEYEEVFPIRRAWCRREFSRDVAPAGGSGGLVAKTVGIETPSGDITIFDEGDFYVMNPNGKTVADYHLDPQMAAVGVK